MPSRASSPTLQFTLPGNETATVTVARLLNAGYAGKDQDDVRAHISELAELGVPAPSTTPTLYPVSPFLAQQTDRVYAQHDHTSGEAEWALIIDDEGRELITAACDHTDRKLEAHGVAWSKSTAPDVLATTAWPLADVVELMHETTLTGWVGTERTTIQRAPAASLLSPGYWLEVLAERGERLPGTILMSGTIPMNGSVDQFAANWGVELSHPELGRITLEYDVVPMSLPIE